LAWLTRGCVAIGVGPSRQKRPQDLRFLWPLTWRGRSGSSSEVHLGEGSGEKEERKGKGTAQKVFWSLIHDRDCGNWGESGEGRFFQNGKIYRGPCIVFNFEDRITTLRERAQGSKTIRNQIVSGKKSPTLETIATKKEGRTGRKKKMRGQNSLPRSPFRKKGLGRKNQR